MKKHIWKIVAAVIVLAILAVSFIWDGIPEQSNEKTEYTHLTAEEKITAAQEIYREQQSTEETTDAQTEESPAPTVTEESTVSQEPAEPVSDGEMTCSLSIRCDTVLNNLQYLDEEKIAIIPENGVIYENKNAVFYEGESVFNVMLRELKKNKIHFEFTKTPAYNSIYIEGIGNLYEFDCGELSGWLYKVNGTTPGCSSSQYMLKDGDSVEFMYSCNLGIDVGGYKEVAGE